MAALRPGPGRVLDELPGGYVDPGEDVMEAFLEATGTEPGEVSADGRFTVIEVECLGACGFPTAVQINEKYYENVKVGDVAGIVEQLKKSEFRSQKSE